MRLNILRKSILDMHLRSFIMRARLATKSDYFQHQVTMMTIFHRKSLQSNYFKKKAIFLRIPVTIFAENNRSLKFICKVIFLNSLGRSFLSNTLCKRWVVASGGKLGQVALVCWWDHFGIAAKCFIFSWIVHSFNILPKNLHFIYIWILTGALFGGC